jgi:hypothetical protein
MTWASTLKHTKMTNGSNIMAIDRNVKPDKHEQHNGVTKVRYSKTNCEEYEATIVVFE